MLTRPDVRVRFTVSAPVGTLGLAEGALAEHCSMVLRASSQTRVAGATRCSRNRTCEAEHCVMVLRGFGPGPGRPADYLMLTTPDVRMRLTVFLPSSRSDSPKAP